MDSLLSLDHHVWLWGEWGLMTSADGTPTRYIIVLYASIEPYNQALKDSACVFLLHVPSRPMSYREPWLPILFCPFAPLSNQSGTCNQLQNTKPKDTKKQQQCPRG